MSNNWDLTTPRWNNDARRSHVPDILYHATASAGFDQFDFARSPIVWFTARLEEAIAMARDFVRCGRGPYGAVYHCKVSMSPVATFATEQQLLEEGNFLRNGCTWVGDRFDATAAVSDALANAGFHGVVDCAGRSDPNAFSYGALRGATIEIVQMTAAAYGTSVRSRVSGRK